MTIPDYYLTTKFKNPENRCAATVLWILIFSAGFVQNHTNPHEISVFL